MYVKQADDLARHKRGGRGGGGGGSEKTREKWRGTGEEKSPSPFFQATDDCNSKASTKHTP